MHLSFYNLVSSITGASPLTAAAQLKGLTIGYAKDVSAGGLEVPATAAAKEPSFHFCFEDFILQLFHFPLAHLGNAVDGELGVIELESVLARLSVDQEERTDEVTAWHDAIVMDDDEACSRGRLKQGLLPDLIAQLLWECVKIGEHVGFGLHLGCSSRLS